MVVNYYDTRYNLLKEKGRYNSRQNLGIADTDFLSQRYGCLFLALIKSIFFIQRLEGLGVFYVSKEEVRIFPHEDGHYRN